MFFKIINKNRQKKMLPDGDFEIQVTFPGNAGEPDKIIFGTKVIDHSSMFMGLSSG